MKDEQVLFSFRSVAQIRRLIQGFQIPEIIRVKGSKFSNEEGMLVLLMRLAYPLRWSDVLVYFPGRDRQELQKIFYAMLDFLFVNWGYLILDNRDYWNANNQLFRFANVIREKFASLPNEAYRQYFEPSEHPDGFDVFGFIDNTIVATTRVGGGPLREGEQAPRNSNLIQQAFWTGWKRLHGLKWQTTDLPNGMNYEVWGPSAARHNDNWTLSKSDLFEKMNADQAGWPRRLKLLGDSAYSEDVNIRIVGDGRGWSSLRQPIEWDYKDLKVTWKYMDYRHVLKLKNQPVAKIVFVCMLLRNAHVTMNGCQTSMYFNCNPPSFEHWTCRGRLYKPVPAGIMV